MTTPTQARINPNIVDATGALACVEGAALFTRAARAQMQRLAARTQQGLRSTTAPIVGEIKQFEAAITLCLGNIQLLVEEHVTHWRTQHELAQDPNLALAAVGYLDALKRGGVGAHASAGGTAGGTATASSGATSYEIDGNIRGPRGAERAMRSCADALGIGQAAALASLRGRLIGPECRLPADSVSPVLLAKINTQLVALGKRGNAHADEFARQMAKIRALPPAMRATQYGTGGWADPRNNH